MRKELKKSYFKRLMKNRVLLNSGSKKWGYYISFSVCNELIKQAIDEACFLFEQKMSKFNYGGDDRDLREKLKNRLINLERGEQTKVYYPEYRLSSSGFYNWVYLKCSRNGRKYRTTSLTDCWIVKRIR